MDSKEKARLIREGNAAFNDGDIRKARELFLKTGYHDGLVRLGDYFMFERKLPMLAYGYYKKAGHQQKIDEIFQRMLFALSKWIGPDKFRIQKQETAKPEADSTELNPDDFQVHPVLRQKALEILAKNNS